MESERQGKPLTSLFGAPVWQRARDRNIDRDGDRNSSFLSLDSKIFVWYDTVTEEKVFIRKNKTLILILFTSKIYSYCFLVGHQDFWPFYYDFHTKLVRIFENEWSGSYITPSEEKKKTHTHLEVFFAKFSNLEIIFMCEIFNLRDYFFAKFTTSEIKHCNYFP